MSEFLYKAGQRAKAAPVLRKRGAIGFGVEQTPLLWQGRRIMIESVPETHPDNQTGVTYVRARDLVSGELFPPFARNTYFASAYTEDGVVYAFTTSRLDDKPQTIYLSEDTSTWHDPRGGHDVLMHVSYDLVTWEQHMVLSIPEWRLWNTSVCNGPDGYVMAFEVRQTGEILDPEIGVPFTTFFARSNDLYAWHMLPKDCAYTLKRYNACPTIRWANGYYYMICLEALPALRYASYIYRTKDFRHWEVGLHNPMLMWGEEDRAPAPGTHFSPELLDLLNNGLCVNASDMDLCEYDGKTHVYYATGDQQTYAFLCEAVYDGPLDRFLQAFFE